MMANRKNMMLTLLLACMFPMVVCAQGKGKTDDSSYLSGAVPEVNGKVVFSKEYEVNGMSKDKIFDRLQTYLTDRMAKNQNAISRVAYANKDEGNMVALADEWIVFGQSFISLDRTDVTYQVTVYCSEGKCRVQIEKIRYTYRDKEKYTAEEWITDKYALNKSKDKLVHGLAKWRRKTVDLADTYFSEIKDVLSRETDTVVKPKPVPMVTTSSGPVIIDVKNEASPEIAPNPVNEVSSSTVSVANTNSSESLKPISLSNIPSSVLSTVQHCKAVVVLGSDMYNMTTMTADKGATIGYVGGKPIISIYFDSKQNVSALENVKTYTLKFIDPNKNQPVLVINCSFVSSQQLKDIHIFMGEIRSLSAE